MEYENNTKQVVHVNGPHEQVIRNDGFNEAYEMDRLLQDVDAVNRSLLTLYPDMEIDPNMVFEQLEVVKDNTNRVYHVVSLLSQLHRTFLNNKEQKGAFQAATDDEPVIVQEEVPQKKDVEVFTIHDDEETAETNNEDDNPVVTITLNDDAPEVKDVYGMLVKDVDLIMDVFPDTDPQEVYAYLEARRDDPQRVANVIEELIHRRPVENVETATDVLPTRQNVPQNLGDERKRGGEAVDANVPVPHKKLRSIKSMEIEESVQDIKEEPVSSNEEDEDIEAPNIAPTVEASTSAATLAAEPSGSSLEEDISASQKLVSQLQVLKDTFPDADRDYLSELLSSCVDDEAKLQATVSDMLEKREYPKLKDQLERERLQALKKEYSSRIFTPEEVLQWFEDPIAFFSDNSTTVSKNYERHAYAQLHNEFPKLTLVDIKRTLSNHNQHYTGAFHKLKEQLQLECKTTKFKRRKARATMSLPEEPDELFYKELAFTRTEEKLKDYLKTKEVRKTQRMEEAKAGGELLTCACCYDDENLPEEMIDCGSGHLFCRECVRRGAEVAIGDGKNGLDCMSDKCGSKFDLPSLQQVLKSSTFSNLLKRIQAEEISNAEIPDLVQCPHCSFAAIMPNQEDKVFRCLNSDCLKETCRFCKEPNHIPLRCEEVEKSDEVKMRTYIENKMTDALVRKCYRCSRRFMKEEGCNKMTCVCGATMCYVCRQPIKDYTHFQKGGCPQMSDTLKLHRDEILQGAESAKKEFVEQHPEMKDAQLKHDPTKDLPKNGSKERQTTVLEYYEDDDDPDYETDYGDISDYSDDFQEASTEEMDDSEYGSLSESSSDSNFTSLVGSATNTPGDLNYGNYALPGPSSQSHESSLESLSQSSNCERCLREQWSDSDMRTLDSDGSNDDTFDQSEINEDFVTMDSRPSVDGSRHVDYNVNDSANQFNDSGNLSSPLITCSNRSFQFDAEDLSQESFQYEYDAEDLSQGSFQYQFDAEDLSQGSFHYEYDAEDLSHGSFHYEYDAEDLSHESGRYTGNSSGSANSSDGRLSTDSVGSISDAGEDSSNDCMDGFETCNAASPSSGRGTNDYPPLLDFENSDSSSS